MINQVTIVGRLTRDPELKEIGSNKHVLNVTVAVNRPFKNQAGENEADFIRCIIWNRVAQNTSEYCAKGSLVGITGRLQTRVFSRDDGSKSYFTEVFADSVRFLDRKKVSTDAEFEPFPEPPPTPAEQNASTETHFEVIR
ncbi:single-stranded DNA-binding protein [Jeotgalibacillus sp. R-1-5s-1]|uniref:single-stranded DNA-binding protein n=1 Tax=Jeotgalibacillus sp. R-1-5s-1 TaxID=2555897 RepID=UPI00106A2547|nr:single-stranded DNA-binding protein [Jeotgalibacillus sp. R-1-5s-1]TFD97022.1 single-stranded DNA-binding protein [Jeotgalibacillus sp. R-1-5s-1]